tara:strand:+ start:1614 stop:2084 length:471 start_codon:yes stop_codon:yes gene_type:complete
VSFNWRLIVGATLIYFAWNGSSLDLPWPPAEGPKVEKPDEISREWVMGIRVNNILPKDRIYLSRFYDAMGWIIMRDSERDTPIISNTEKLSEFHAGSLQLAIDRDDVGKYAGLGKSVDDAFKKVLGDDVSPIEGDSTEAVILLCNALSWRFAIYGE